MNRYEMYPCCRGNGLSCVDIDECTNDPCSANATCTNFPGMIANF